MMQDKTTIANARMTAHWLEMCSAALGLPQSECAGCPHLGQACSDGLMEEAAKILAILYPRHHPDHREANSVIYWLERCIGDNSCLAICKQCPFAYDCPDGLLRRSAELIRAACYSGDTK